MFQLYLLKADWVDCMIERRITIILHSTLEHVHSAQTIYFCQFSLVEAIEKEKKIRNKKYSLWQILSVLIY